MASEEIKKLNGLSITVGNHGERFSTGTEGGPGLTDPDSPFGDEDRTPVPMPPTPSDDDGHNSDGHHHHEHSHDGDDTPFSQEQFEEYIGPGDLINIQTYQSELFQASQVSIFNNDSGELNTKTLRLHNVGSRGEEEALDTIETIGALLQQFPTQGDDSVLNLAIEPFYIIDEEKTRIGIGPHDVPRRLTFKANNVFGDTNGERLALLPFPNYFEEFDITLPRTQITSEDSNQWVNPNVAMRPDIQIFIQAYIFAQNDRISDAVNLLDDYYAGGGYKFSEVHPIHYNDYILGGRELPSINGNTDLPGYFPFFHYANIVSTSYSFDLIIKDEDGLDNATFFIPGLRFKLIGPLVEYEDIEEFQTIEPEPDPIIAGCVDPEADNYNPEATEDDDSCVYSGCTDPDALNYDERATIDNGSCVYSEDPVVDEDDPINDILQDNYSNDEEISADFGVPEVDIEQTIYEPYDPFSGMDIDLNSFQNTSNGLKNSDSDGRIALGMFVFDEDNLLQNDFPDILQEPFKQYEKINLVPNSQGRFVKSVWQNNYGDGARERFFIPENGWGYCTYDALRVQDQKRNENLYQGGDDYPDDDFWGKPIEDETNGSEFISSFEQLSSDGTQDSQGTIGYAGFYAYFFDYRIGSGQPDQTLLRLQHNLVSASAQTSNEFDICNKFFMQNQIDSLGMQEDELNDGQLPAASNHASYIFPRKCTAVGNRSSDSGNSLPYQDTWFPNVAKWIIDKDFSFDWEQEVECYSFGRCLEFLGTNFKNGEFDWNDNGTDDIHNKDFEWDNHTNMNVGGGGGITQNQYRGLNQVIKIYNPYAYDDKDKISPFSTIEVKFKMKTLDLFVPDTEQYKGVMYDEDNPPQVEIAIVDGDGSTASPLRTKNRVEGSRTLPYAYSHGYWPHGDFNSIRYDADLNDDGTLNRKYSNFGSMGRFKNTEPNKWETFSYQFTAGQVFRYGSGIIRPLWLIVQAAGEFYGRVLLDDFEVYESHDFIPDVDVRKKISVGNYGKADLTKYYDKELQPEEYKDSQGPLEAQFYFYPQHPSNEIFNQKRTPIYQDFKKGKFYIHNIDWGDGSAEEFTSEPEQIDENTALYHTYKTSGVFEVVGTMIRMKVDTKGENVGIIKSKKFRLRININQGSDEDFQFFGADGFSFIPYKNTLPIIGGYSEQSIYYKATKRQLGFISDNIKTPVLFRYGGDKLKTEIALDKMDSSFRDNFELLQHYIIPRELDDEIIFNSIETYPSELGKSVGDTDITNIKFYNKSMDIVELLGFQCDEFSEINTIKLNNPENGANYTHHALAELNVSPSAVFPEITLPEGVEDYTQIMTLIYDDFNNPNDNNHMRVGYRFRVNNEDDIQYVDAGNSNLRVPTPYLKAGKTYTFSTHIYIPDGFESQGSGNQIQLGVIQTPADNDWAANENFLDSAFCCTEEDFALNLCLYNGEERTNDDQISYGASLQWSYFAGCFYNDYGTMSSKGETPKSMTYTVLDTAPIDENNQWYRMSGTFTPLNPDEYGDYVSFRIIPFEVGRPYITDDVYYVVGAQLEEGDTMSPYTTEDFDFGDCLRYDSNIPDNPRYWKNIIPENYSIYDRVGIDLNINPPVDIFVEQEWLDSDGNGEPDYYYPVLPNYGLDGNFIQGDLTNDKIQFPLEGMITDEMDSNENLLINITSDSIDSNVYNDNSGNQNNGFAFSDYKPEFEDETFKPRVKRNTDLMRTSKNNGAF